MKFNLALIALFHVTLATPSYRKSHGLRISTTSGHANGKIDPDLPNVRQFLGIPFAQPPLGDLRFSPPESLSNSDAEMEATRLPPSCMQFQSTDPNSFGKQDVLQFFPEGLNHTATISEDCLTLSVWAPKDVQVDESGRGLPVLIFSYGGAFQLGGEDVPYQIPTQWVNRTPNHIVVSFNYRLNIFGFPNAPGLDQQNLAYLDHRLVIEWCKENIAAFGGDPNRMILWGQSAGAAAADVYSFAWYKDPIITGMALDSGTAIGQFPTGDVDQKNFTFVADHVGCDGLANDPEQQLSCMRSVPASAINDFIAHYSDNAPNPSLDFRPVIDEKIVFSDYWQRTAEGKQANIPAIQGTNRDEGEAFAPYHPQGVNQTIALYLGLSNIICWATAATKLRQRYDRLTFRYSYAGNFSNVSPRRWLGAYHSSELPMLMGTHPNYRGSSTPLEYATSHAFQDAYVAFARDPVNGLLSQDWLQYSEMGSATVRQFGGDGVAAKDISLADTEAYCIGTRPNFTVHGFD